MNLKEDIGRVVFGAMWDAVETVSRDGDEDGPYPGYGEYVDDILAKVREALLSDEARRVGGRTLVDQWELQPTEEDLAERMGEAMFDTALNVTMEDEA